MKKVTDLLSTECIHCKTREQWNKILALDPFNTIVCTDDWKSYKEESVYHPYRSGYCDTIYAINNKYTVYPASDFLEPEFVYGELILVGDEQPPTKERFFLTLNFKNSKDLYVTTDENGRIYSWKYAKKIVAKPIPEYTMKQLMDKVGHKFKIKE